MGALGKGIDEVPLGVIDQIPCFIFRKCIDPGQTVPVGKRKRGPSNPSPAAHLRASWGFTEGVLEEKSGSGAPGWGWIPAGALQERDWAGGAGSTPRQLPCDTTAWGGCFTTAGIKIKRRSK